MTLATSVPRSPSWAIEAFCTNEAICLSSLHYIITIPSSYVQARSIDLYRVRDRSLMMWCFLLQSERFRLGPCPTWEFRNCCRVPGVSAAVWLSLTFYDWAACARCVCKKLVGPLFLRQRFASNKWTPEGATAESDVDVNSNAVGTDLAVLPVGGGVMHCGSRLILASLQCRDGARRVFTDQADIASTNRETPWGVRRIAGRVSCILLRTACEADFLAYGWQRRRNWCCLWGEWHGCQARFATIS